MKLSVDNQTELPSGVQASYANGMLTIKGPKGEVVRKMHDPELKLKVEVNLIKISCPNGTRRHKRQANSQTAHVKNMIAGVQEPFKYVLKICSGHFPMNVAISGEQLLVNNFLGEKFPRIVKLKKGVTVKVEGDKISVESCDLDLAGQMASDIELLTSKSNRDLRVFQDGIYMIEKAGKKVGES